MARRRVAVVFGATGGMSDAGKFALHHALKSPSTYRDTDVVSVLVHAPTEGPEVDGDGRVVVATDVTDTALAAAVNRVVAESNPIVIDVSAADAAATMQQALVGVDAVVGAFGNRQPFMPRTLAATTRLVTSACVANHVPRLVLLSSFGLGGEPLPWSPIRVL